MAFHVGQKVVCVDDSVGQLTRQRELVKGSIYTVRSLPPWSNGLYLQEIVLPKADFGAWEGHEISFFSTRFRPIVERKTDISALTAILNGHRVPESV